jgi:atypical dual specificity phosphatase
MGRTGKIYRRVRAFAVSEPTNFSWVRDRRLAGSGKPYSRRQVKWLRRQGVTRILCLAEDPLPGEWLDGVGFRHMPMKDHAPLELARMKEAADYIDSALREGQVVAVHCLAGKGRTGSVLAAYLIAHEGLTAGQALGELRRARPGSVERPQEPRVLEFEGYVRAS